MTFPRHDFRAFTQPRERSDFHTVERWLTLIAGLVFAYSVFVLIAMGGM